MATNKSIEEFYQLVKQDASLQEQLKSTTDMDSFVNMVIQLGQERGYEFTVDEVKMAIASVSLTALNEDDETFELSDEQLLAVAGGKKGSSPGPIASSTLSGNSCITAPSDCTSAFNTAFAQCCDPVIIV
jgi:predicted ribosomally synthesized peptide with nif11-like leader